MKLSVNAFLSSLAIARILAAPIDPLCGDYSAGILIPDECTGDTVSSAIRDIFETTSCGHSFGRELRHMTQTGSNNAARAHLQSLCDGAYTALIGGGFPSSDWSDLTTAGIDLEEFFQGKGFLNSESFVRSLYCSEFYTVPPGSN